ncbi:MAG: PrsW family glutamic-type intramembrane protease [Flavihumibacter sp.]
MKLLVFSLAPVIAIIWFIYWMDQYDKEPLQALVKAFLLGVLAVVLPVLYQNAALNWLQQHAAPQGWLYFGVISFLVVALSEEVSKFLMLRYYAYPRPFFNEPFDGIIYGVMVAMGFATIENIGYVTEYGLSTAFSRMFLSVPAHGCFGVLMGYYAGLAKFSGKGKAGWLMARGLLLSILFHGVYDLFLFVQLDSNITSHIPATYLFGTAMMSYGVAIRLSWQAIKLHQATSKNNFHS